MCGGLTAGSWGGQVEKIRKLRAMCDAVGADPWIEVDGASL